MEKKVKVLHVITRLILGGAQENTVLSCEGLHATGRYDVSLASGPAIGPEGSLEDRARWGGYEFIVIPQMRREICPWRDIVTLAKLWWLFVIGHPDVVHTHSSKAGILGRWAAWAAGVPLIVHTVHGLPFHEFQARWENWLYRALEWTTGEITDRMVFVGDVMRRKSIDARLTTADRARVVYSGIETAAFVDCPVSPSEARKALGIPENRCVIAMISRLAPLKGHDDLLDAFRRLARDSLNVHLLLIGDGERRRELEQLVRSLDLAERVTFTGLVAPEEIPRLLQAASIIAHTSVREGLPRACVQGLLCGRPVVAFDFDGAREVVRDGVTGFLVSDATALAEKLALLVRDPARAIVMGVRGRQAVRERFDVAAMIDGLESVYRE